MTIFLLHILLVLAEKLNHVNLTFVLMLLIITIFRTKTTLNNNKNEDISRQLEGKNEIKLLKWKNDELRMLLSNYKYTDKPIEEMLKYPEKLIITSEIRRTEMPSNVPKCEPSLQFEVTRRKIIREITDFWLYTKNQLGFIKDNTTKFKIHTIIKFLTENKRVILGDLQNLTKMDGLEDWRKKEAHSLSTLVQKRLNYLQNPKNCRKAKKFNCILGGECGFGCQIHYVVYCLIMAYGYNRTLTLNSNDWHYKSYGWMTEFKPVNEKCPDISIWSHPIWQGNSTDRVITLPLIADINPRPPILPLAIPEDLAPRLVRLHGDPIVWWVGQFVKYLFRPEKRLQKIINETARSIGFEKPIVGIHLWQTKKLMTKASYHNLYSYMKHVEEFYQQLSLKQKIEEKRVYISTDNIKIFKEAKKNFPKFKFIGDLCLAKTASLETKFTAESLRGIILDIHFLSMTDYLVCSFSSKLCRIAYEFMQTLNPDASFNFRSVDDSYYFDGQNDHYHEVKFDHQPEGVDEINLTKGDQIKIFSSRNGYSKGFNQRTKETGIFPSFKVSNKIQIAKFPTYPEVKV